MPRLLRELLKRRRRLVCFMTNWVRNTCRVFFLFCKSLWTASARGKWRGVSDSTQMTKKITRSIIYCLMAGTRDSLAHSQFPGKSGPSFGGCVDSRIRYRVKDVITISGLYLFRRLNAPSQLPTGYFFWWSRHWFTSQSRLMSRRVWEALPLLHTM